MQVAQVRELAPMPPALTAARPDDITRCRLPGWGPGRSQEFSGGVVHGTVVVVYRGTRHRLAPDRLLTFGRAAGSDVQLPADDDHLSRRAGTLLVLTDCVLVRNVSASKPFVLRPPRGEDHVVEPGAAITSLPHRQFEIVLAGRAGTVVSLQVDARSITPMQEAPTIPGGQDKQTVTTPIELSPPQKRVLLALCAPVLLRQGSEAQPASYTRIGRVLTLSPQYVRNVVKGLREELASFGLAGLTGEESGGAGEDFRRPLAQWAIRNGWVDADSARPYLTVPGGATEDGGTDG